MPLEDITYYCFFMEVGSLVLYNNIKETAHIKTISSDHVTIRYNKKIHGKYTHQCKLCDLTEVAPAWHKQCEYCGKVFNYKKQRKRRGNVRFCSSRCRGYPKKCVICGKIFKIHQKKGVSLCSYKCKKEDVRRRQIDALNNKEFNLDEVYYYNYKEPMRKFKYGFGYDGALAYSKDKKKVQCHFCGKLFGAITTSHIEQCLGVCLYNEKHGNTPVTDIASYKKTTKLSISSALVGEETREKLIRAGFKSVETGGRKFLKRVDKNNIIKNNKARTGSKISLEAKNKRGTCPDQLLEKIKVVEKHIGQVPSKKDFYKYYGGRYLGIIYETFGSWRVAVEKAGLTPRVSKGNTKYTREDLLEYLREFYKRKGRTPTYSDHRRGILPPRESYQRFFTTLNEARRAAGIPILIQVGRRHWVEASL
jgi:hypothetical protein